MHAFEQNDPAAVFFVERFAAIYAIERRAKVEGLSASLRLELRQEQSLPLLREIRERADQLKHAPVTRRMLAGITYVENQWERLVVPFERDGRLEIDNGAAERRLRPVASGRKSWLFAGSENGAERFADMLSLVSSAQAAGVDPGVYLADVIGKLANGYPSDSVGDLLPHHWAAQRQ